MKQTILRTISQRLIDDVEDFVDVWEADPASLSLKQRMSALWCKWMFICSCTSAQWTAPFRKPLKRQEPTPESVNVEQIDLFAFIEEMETHAEPDIVNAKTAPAKSLPVVPRISPIMFFRQLLRGLYWFWILAHNLFGIAQWVNVYTVTRGFGGRQAGGWYYLKHTCEKSRQVGFWEAQALRQHWLEQYSLSHKWGDLYSASGGQDVIVCIESSKAARTTRQAPRFGEFAGPIPYLVIHRR